MHPFVILALVLALRFIPLQSEPCAAMLTVAPASGPVGTVVTLTGRAFTTACPLLRGTDGDGLIMQSAGGTSTFGYAPVADPGRTPPITSDGSFTVTFTIPATLSPFHGVGGGSVRPGPYYFHMQPPVGTVSTSAAEADTAIRAETFTVTGAPSPASDCRFVLGFATLHSLLPQMIGQCLENEQHNPANGDGLQHTTNGLLVWRKADNFTAFTDGYHTWINGPTGLEYRLNTQRFAWEANPDHLPVIPDAHVGATQGEQPAGPKLITTASTLGQDAGPLVFRLEGTGFGAGETVTVQGTYTPAFLVATGDPQSPFHRESCDPVPLGPVHATADGAGRFSLTLQGNTNLLKGGDLSIIAMGSNGAHITLGGGGSLPEVVTLPAGCRA